MFGLFKRKKVKDKCNHDWNLLKKGIEEQYEYNGIYTEFYDVNVVYCYCPKCKRRDKVTPLEWSLREQEQRLIEEYTRAIIFEFK